MNWLVVQTYLKYFAIMLRNRVGSGQRFNTLPDPSKNTPKYFLTGMLRIKNEGRFLPELLAYHHLLGFEHFYLYNNNSEDDLHAILAPFVERGLVTIIDWPAVPASPACYFHFWDTFGSQSRWVSFFDADEYLVESKPGLLMQTLRRMDKAPALALNWRYYGSSYQEVMPEGLLIENFIRRESVTNSHIKVIVQPARAHSPFNPHNFIYHWGRLARSTSGGLVLGSRYVCESEPTMWLNHYVYRSRENAISKTTRGFADPQGERDQARNMRVIDQNFKVHNDIVDDTAARTMGSQVADFLQELGYGSPYVLPREHDRTMPLEQRQKTS